jgi:hypothetical protein
MIRTILATGRHEPSLGFTTAYFHTADELVAELTEDGLIGVSIAGVEGPAWPVLKGVEAHTGTSLGDSPLFRSALAAARLPDAEPALLPASSHFLAFGRAPDRRSH